MLMMIVVLMIIMVMTSQMIVINVTKALLMRMILSIFFSHVGGHTVGEMMVEEIF